MDIKDRIATNLLHDPLTESHLLNILQQISTHNISSQSFPSLLDVFFQQINTCFDKKDRFMFFIRLIRLMTAQGDNQSNSQLINSLYDKSITHQSNLRKLKLDKMYSKEFDRLLRDIEVSSGVNVLFELRMLVFDRAAKEEYLFARDNQIQLGPLVDFARGRDALAEVDKLIADVGVKNGERRSLQMDMMDVTLKELNRSKSKLLSDQSQNSSWVVQYLHKNMMQAIGDIRVIDELIKKNRDNN